MRTRKQEVAAYNFLRVASVAERLNCSRAQVHGLIESGELEAINIGLGKRPEYRIDPTSLDQFIERKKVRP